MIRMKTAVSMLGGVAAIALIGSVAHPVALLAQTVKATLVRSVDEPGREPYQETSFYTFNGTAAVVGFSAVPVGKRLVIKRISSRMLLFSNHPPSVDPFGFVDAALNTTTQTAVGLNAATVFVPHTGLAYSPAAQDKNFYANQDVLMFADPGTAPVFTARLNLDGTYLVTNQSVTISGYYVDIP